MMAGIESLVLSWVNAHQQLVAGFALGIAMSHLPQLVGKLFMLAMRIPWLKNDIHDNPQRYKDAIDAVRKELVKDIEDTAAGPDPDPASKPKE